MREWLVTWWTWIQMNPDAFGRSVAAIVVSFVVAVSAVKIGGLRRGLLTLMLRLERARRQGQLGTIDGPQIMPIVISWAMTTLVPRLPFWVRPMITPDRLQKWAQSLFDASLDLLDDGMLNGTRPELPDKQQPAS
jgi:hypothetical protein